VVPSGLKKSVRKMPAQKMSIVVVCGPTGSGKGSLARGLARKYNGEVVSADSRKIYRQFDIGTAKPSASDRAELSHHLIDIIDPQETYTAARYKEDADKAIHDISARGRLPIVVGGTGLYIRTLLHGIITTPSRDDQLRHSLQAEEDANPGSLYAKLKEVDPQTAERLEPADLVRIIRALEVFYLCQKPMSEIQAEHGLRGADYYALQVAPRWETEALKIRINKRVDRMMAAGWLEETKTLLDQGLADCAAFQMVGYRQLKQHCLYDLPLEEAIEKIKVAHRRYAKRQVVWFKAVADLNWLEAPIDKQQLDSMVEDFTEVKTI
jgi:tRNA dimethylallyltransferase